MEEIYEFLRVQRERLELNICSAEFVGLISPVNDAYLIANRALPPETDLMVHRLFLLCNRSFLVEASLIAAGHPDDSVPVTRRAIEMARVAFALAYDKENTTRWLQEETRMARWTARLEGTSPPRLRVTLKLPGSHELLDLLGKWEGILSDAATHFTPEFLSHYSWEQRENSLFLSYFVTDRAHLLRTLRFCVVVHMKIHELFDETVKGLLRRNKAWCDAMERIKTAGLQFIPPSDEDRLRTV